MERKSPRTVREALGVAGGSASCRSSNEQEDRQRTRGDLGRRRSGVGSDRRDPKRVHVPIDHDASVGARCLRWIYAFEIMRLGRARLSLFLDGWPAKHRTAPSCTCRRVDNQLRSPWLHQQRTPDVSGRYCRPQLLSWQMHNLNCRKLSCGRSPQGTPGCR